MAEQFDSWLGSWVGRKHLWLSPEADEIVSDSSAQIAKVAKGKFLQINYEWQMENDSQEGSILLPTLIGEKESHSVWLDSWHTRRDMMVCEVEILEDKVAMMGTYHAPPDENWGWRLELAQSAEQSLSLRMFNISPECEECLAVEINYHRAA